MYLPLAEPCLIYGCSNRGASYENTRITRMTQVKVCDGADLDLVPFFVVRVLNSFERVPVPRVTENWYGAEQRTVGMGM